MENPHYLEKKPVTNRVKQTEIWNHIGVFTPPYGNFAIADFAIFSKKVLILEKVSVSETDDNTIL